MRARLPTLPTPMTSYSKLRYPLGLVILTLCSLFATSVVFEQHDVLVRAHATPLRSLASNPPSHYHHTRRIYSVYRPRRRAGTKSTNGLEAEMEAFWRVVRKIERHEHVTSLPALHVWQGMDASKSPQLIITLSPHVPPSLRDEEVLKFARWACERVRGSVCGRWNEGAWAWVWGGGGGAGCT
ncbi:uncharacterized protein EDB91DRAFT_1338887 [Suillus paluster]|uniref:uncharacterized protein n=1 Tax=Suillus paluster TaxID=48578 RepID=UPI001B86FE4B|nr:uncharacterized protein EDB91DRAFT_1338887 [Suillus paluster]KAG1730282.1 hypothetical protein EDB91DRAFT_1338887 [Suillus paluster]